MDDDQPDLFGKAPDNGAYARRTDPQTSKDAAKDAPVGKLEYLVYEYLFIHGGSTTSEISVETGIRDGSITPRMRRLVEKGLVIDSGETRQSRHSSKQQIVWVALKAV